MSESAVNYSNKENPSYYAIIPASVRYDSKLSANAKLLYGEITALSHKEGYCWSTNSYFAGLYGVSNRTISKWINLLEKCGYIKIKTIYKPNTKEIEQRRIYINDGINERINTPMEENVYTYGKNLPYPMEEKFYTPMEEKFQDNIINGIITVNKNNKVNEYPNPNESNPTGILGSEENKDIYTGGRPRVKADSRQSVHLQIRTNYSSLSGKLVEEIIKWYDVIGANKKISFKQIDEKLNELLRDCNNDFNIATQQIHYSYLNNYLSWYPPKTTLNTKHPAEPKVDIHNYRREKVK